MTAPTDVETTEPRLLVERHARHLRRRRGADPENPPLQDGELITAAGELRQQADDEAEAYSTLVVQIVRASKAAGLQSPSITAAAAAAGVSRETFYRRLAITDLDDDS